MPPKNKAPQGNEDSDHAEGSTTKKSKTNLGGASQMSWYNALACEEKEKLAPVLRNLV